jgi:hypothetical protein
MARAALHVFVRPWLRWLGSSYVKPVLVQLKYFLAGALPRQQRGPPAHHRVQPLVGRRAGG